MTAWVLLALACFSQAAGPAASAAPRVLDERLTLELFAAEPQITTPTGIAVDDQGRVLAIENNTHFRPKDYPRALGDRILRMADRDGDGRADEIVEFYTGAADDPLKDTMNLARHASGGVFVATRREIFRLDDVDGDGKAEKRTDLVKLVTDGNYPHNGLSGFAFGPYGQLVFGFGENLGASYSLTGSDGVTLRGGGEGGNVYLCQLNGRRLRQVATGFWNPFHVGFDAFGRLFCVDNDPDSRPPCRLLHIVEGGDYGFKFRNGRKGVHPFTAWNGELPGTLPMVAGTGEAPCAVLAYESDQLPAEYRGDLLVTSWGDHRLERYTLRPRGASFAAEMQPVVAGDQNFRPVGLALAPDGSLYFSDWVDKSYPVHNKGRIWRLRAKQAPERKKPTGDPVQDIAHAHRPIAEAAAAKLTKEQAQWVIASLPDARARALAAAVIGPQDHGNLPLLAAAESSQLWQGYHTFTQKAFRILRRELDPQWLAQATPEMRAQALRNGVSSETTDADQLDPFVVQGVAQGDLRLAPAAPAPDADKATWNRYWADVREDLRVLDFADAPPWLQLPTVLSVLRSGSPPTELLEQLLQQATARDAVLVLVIAAAEGRDENGRPTHARLAPQVERVLREFPQDRQLFEVCLAALDRLTGGQAGGKNEPAGETFALRLLTDEKHPAALRQMALRTLAVDHPGVSETLLLALSRTDSAALRREALRTLRLRGGAAAAARLGEVARDTRAAPAERAEAVLGLPVASADERQAVQAFLQSGEAALALSAVRALAGPDFDRAKREQAARKIQADAEPPAAAEPKSLAEWVQRATGPGDAERGERLFFHPRLATCYKCHEYQGRGGRVGPDLTHYGKTATLERLVQSLVEPSREIAPQFTPFVLQTTSGQTKTGVYVGEEVDGTVRYADEQGAVFRLHPRDVEERRASPQSIMPSGLPAQLTAQELRDLAAFLLKK